MTETTVNLDGILRKVQALIARADHEGTPPHEASACRDKADALMFKYKIDSLTAPEQPGILRPKPVWRSIFICRTSSEWRHFYSALATSILDREQCRYSQAVEHNPEDGARWAVLKAVGYDGDLRYAELLITSAVQAFGRHLEPKPDPADTFEANCLRLRQGGMERRRIAMLLLGGWQTENEMKAKNRKVTKAIKAEAARIGKPHLAEELLGRGTNIATYRKSYANGFYWTLRNRLRTHQLAEASEAQGLVLASAAHEVDEAYYEAYPHLRPVASVESSASTYEQCEKCAQAKSGYCREHGWLRPKKARETAYSRSGEYAGSNAARSVDLGSVGTGKVGGSNDRKELD